MVAEKEVWDSVSWKRRWSPFCLLHGERCHFKVPAAHLSVNSHVPDGHSAQAYGDKAPGCRRWESFHEHFVICFLHVLVTLESLCTFWWGWGMGLEVPIDSPCARGFCSTGSYFYNQSSQKVYESFSATCNEKPTIWDLPAISPSPLPCTFPTPTHSNIDQKRFTRSRFFSGGYGRFLYGFFFPHCLKSNWWFLYQVVQRAASSLEQLNTFLRIEVKGRHKFLSFPQTRSGIESPTFTVMPVTCTLTVGQCNTEATSRPANLPPAHNATLSSAMLLRTPRQALSVIRWPSALMKEKVAYEVHCFIFDVES